MNFLISTLGFSYAFKKIISFNYNNLLELGVSVSLRLPLQPSELWRKENRQMEGERREGERREGGREGGREGVREERVSVCHIMLPTG